MAVDPIELRINIAKQVSGICDNVYVYNEDGELESLQSLTALDNDVVLDDILDADVING